MGHQQKKFSIFSIFKSRRGGRRDHYNYNYYGGEESGRRIFPSDGDKGEHWVGENRIDEKASAFIAKFHATTVSESERYVYT